MSSNAWFAQNVNCKNKKMPTTTEANPPEFYLHRQVQQFCARHPDVSFNFLCRTATEFFKNMDHQGNSELRARIAIKVAIRMCVPK